MLSDRFFRGFAFPWLLVDGQDRPIAAGDGALFPAPKTSLTSKVRAELVAFRFGWHRSSDDFAVYVTQVSPESAERLVVFGLKVSGLSRSQGKSEGLSIKSTPEQVEAYVKKNFLSLAESNSLVRSILGQQLHEIRSLNTDIYNAVYRLRDDIERYQFSFNRDFSVIRNIEELSKLISNRADFLDVISNPAILDLPGGTVPVYRAFDRVVRSVQPSAAKRHVRLNIRGNSFGTTDGKKLFDQIPYLVIQNAIKYSPPNEDVIVSIYDQNPRIEIDVSSLGPVVDEDERERIFAPGYRGRNASMHQPEGSGIGLYFLSQLISRHSGASLQFIQEGDVRLQRSVPYRRTILRMSFPLKGFDSSQ